MNHKELLGPEGRREAADWLRNAAAHMRKVGVHQGSMFDRSEAYDIVPNRELPCCWNGAMIVTAPVQHSGHRFYGPEAGDIRCAMGEHPRLRQKSIANYNDSHPNPSEIPNTMDEVADWLIAED